MTLKDLQDMLLGNKGPNIVCIHCICYDYMFVKIYMHGYLNTPHTHFSICGVKEIRRYVHCLLLSH